MSVHCLESKAPKLLMFEDLKLFFFVDLWYVIDFVVWGGMVVGGDDFYFLNLFCFCK